MRRRIQRDSNAIQIDFSLGVPGLGLRPPVTAACWWRWVLHQVSSRHIGGMPRLEKGLAGGTFPEPRMEACGPILPRASESTFDRVPTSQCSSLELSWVRVVTGA